MIMNKFLKWLFGNRHSVFDVVVIGLFVIFTAVSIPVAILFLVTCAIISAVMQQYVNKID